MSSIGKIRGAGLAALMLGGSAVQAQAQNIFVTDVIVNAGLCVGLDCLSTEVFGEGRLKLKDQNVRILLEDTSTNANFATGDWQITANSSLEGGDSFFAITDIEAGADVFAIADGAPQYGIYLDDAGNVGLGTGAPVTNLHIHDTNTPAIRLEQLPGTFAGSAWDVAANESNFFVREVATNALPFRIQNSAPGDALVIAEDGSVGLGTDTPGVPLDVVRDGAATVRLTSTATSAGDNEFLHMRGAGALYLTFEDTLYNDRWYVTKEKRDNGNFELTSQVDGGAPIVAFDLFPNGNLTISGSLTQNSDRRNKMAIEPVDAADILGKVAALPLSEWTYKHDAQDGVRHIGPMAQDFHAAFGVGASPTGISAIDTGGVALAAIQALHAEVAVLRSEIDRLRARGAD